MTTTNVNRPWGFKPTRMSNGEKYNGQTQIYGFAAAQSSAAYTGDPVFFDATNRATAITLEPYPGIPYVYAATSTMTTNVFRGVISGFLPAPEYNMSPTASLGLMYRVASTLRYGLIVDDYNTIFEAQEAGNAYVSSTDNAVNKTSDITYAAGNSVTGISGSYLNTPAASGVKPFRILRYTQRPDNFGFVAADNPSYAHFDVMIANSDLAQAQVGA